MSTKAIHEALEELKKSNPGAALMAARAEEEVLRIERAAREWYRLETDPYATTESDSMFPLERIALEAIP